MLKCERIFALLKRIDPALATHIADELGIEPQLWALRWVRLLFTREFPLEEAMQLWDGIIAYDGLAAGMKAEGGGADRHPLILIDYICVAMLLRIRARLLAASYSGALQLLLRYPLLPNQDAQQAARPPPSGAEERSTHPSQQHTDLLVRQAILLHNSPTPATGVQIVIQNRDLLGVEMIVDKVESPTSEYQHFGSTRRAAGAGSQPLRSAPHTIAAGRRGNRPAFGPDTFGGRTSGPPLAFSPAAFLPEGISDLARGIYERSDALGINRAVGNAMSNVQSRVGAYAAAAVAQRNGGADVSGFPPLAADLTTTRKLSDATPPQFGVIDRAGLARGDPAAELVLLKTTNNAMGQAVASCIDTLEARFKSESAELSEEDLASLMALTALKHIRDVLTGSARDFNADILGPQTSQPPRSAAAPVDSRGSGEQARTTPAVAVSPPGSGAQTVRSSRFEATPTPSTGLPRVPFKPPSRDGGEKRPVPAVPVQASPVPRQPRSSADSASSAAANHSPSSRAEHDPLTASTTTAFLTARSTSTERPTSPSSGTVQSDPLGAM